MARRFSVLCVLGTLALGLANRSQIRAEPPTLGKPFPEVWLPRLSGGHASISSFRGEKLLVLVYASW